MVRISIGTLGYCTAATVFQVGQVAHCKVLLDIVGGFAIVAVPATSLLFFFRVRAVYNNSRIITGFFAFLWVGILGTSVLIPLSIEGGMCFILHAIPFLFDLSLCSASGIDPPMY